jgi:multiple sugar transport system substrate-binding protein
MSNSAGIRRSRSSGEFTVEGEITRCELVKKGAVAGNSLASLAAAGRAEAAHSVATRMRRASKAVTLRFIWLDWPPARLLEKFANEQYGKVNPNVKFKVDVLPQAQWHDAIFTQFAAHKTSFDMPILDSQFIGEAVTGKHIVNLTKWAEANIDLKAFSPNLLAAYGEYPQAVTGYYTKGAPLYGLPLLADCPAFINRKDIVGPHPPRTWAQMIAWGKQAMAKHKGIYGLGFQQAGVYDVAANTFNTVLWIYGGNLWNPKTHQIEGVINNAAGQKAMMVLVKAMVPQAPPGPPSCSFPWRGCSRTRSRTRRTSTPFPPSSSSSSRRSGTTPTSCARRARRATSRSARTSSTA